MTPSAHDADDQATLDELARLITIMRQLRDPQQGCPWDVQQTFESIAPYTIEEAYEVADAIANGDVNDIRDELGDLLLQVVFHARMAEEAALFSFDDVVEAISDKMIRRHPHVFGDGTADNADAVRKTWEEIKAEEKAAKSKAAADASPDSLMNDIPLTLPGLSRAVKIQNRAARIGFDWPDIEPVFDKLHEEIDEVRAAITSGAKDEMEDEVGDLLFVVANIARHLKIDPEKAVRRTNGKFIARFKHVETLAAQSGKDDLTLEELEAFWQSAKKAEKDAR